LTGETGLRVQAEQLKDLCQRAFDRLGVAQQDARITADVLVAADLRGISSHGVGHLRRYVRGLQTGVMIARPAEHLVSPLVSGGVTPLVSGGVTPPVSSGVTQDATTAVIDAGGGMGPPVAWRAMQRAIEMARASGAGFVAVRNSNHFGIAGYYAMMALEHDCIGLTMTNANAFVVPTFGRNALLSTNAIALAAPADQERPFVLDMSTTAAAYGKLEINDRLEKPIPLGWATDEHGAATDDPHRVLENLSRRAGGGLLPLGGEGELLGGHKGYGLGLMVNILCGLLAGAAYADLAYPKTPDGKPLPANIGHFLGAWRIDAFRPVQEFRAAMDDLQQRLKNAPRAEGHDRIYIHGEKEYENAERHLQEGIPLDRKLVTDLQALARELKIESDLGWLFDQ